ncbi:MAG: PEP-CTERM sorting domain-containing protein [Planctomycetia bacterium]|nr:PEP-CTERM sorting domain-containing protein [Planctomycetia bacterium]
MTTSRITIRLATTALLFAAWFGNAGPGQAVTIYQIQYTDLSADPTGSSPCAGQTLDCAGGIVVNTWTGSQPRLVLQDPACPAGWGAIQVKGFNGANTFAGVSVGDWVSLTGVYVEEYRGTTFLQFGGTTGPAPAAAFTVQSTGNALPPPVVVALEQIAAPLEGPPGSWRIVDHRAEPYESMRLTIEDVAVTELGLGKATDNYNVHNGNGDAWLSDYMNADRGYSDLYHPYVELGAEFVSVTGILEQYQKSGAVNWDYYQLLTTCTNDFVVPEPATCVLLLTGLAALVGGMLRRRGR